MYLLLLQWIPWFLRMKRPGEADEPGLSRSPADPQSRTLSSPGTTTTSSSATAAPANPAQLNQSLSRLCQHSQLNGHALHAEPEPPQRSGAVIDGGQGASAEQARPALLRHHPPSSRFESTQSPPATPDPGSEAAPLPLGGPAQPAAVRRQLQALLAEVQFLVERVKEQDRQLSLAEQWQFAASVIDRLFLVGFSVFNIICTIAILMAAPHFGEALSKDFL